MAEKRIELWQLEDWNQALFHHYFAETGDGTVLTRLSVTSEELGKAVKGIAGPVEARESLVGALRKSLGHRSLGSDAHRRAAGWNLTADLPPPFVVHLLFTCMVVGDMAEQLESVGDFRKRLTVLLGWGTGHGLDRLPGLWHLLSDWLKVQYETPQPVRRLILPSPPPHLSIIGYTYCLAFPTRRDQERLRKIFREDQLLGSEPFVARVFNLLEDRIAQFTPQFQKTYREFRDLYHVSPRAVSAATAFWSVIRDAALKTSAERAGRRRLPKLQLALETDIDGYALVIMSSRDFLIKDFRTVSFPSGLKDYPFLVTSTDDKPIEAALLKAAHDDSAPTFPSIFRDLGSAIREGILLFVADEAGQMYVLARELPEAGKVLGLVPDALLDSFEVALQKAALEAEYSSRRSDAYPGWNEIEIADGAALSAVDFSADSALSDIRCLQQVLRPSRIVVVGGARAGQSYLGLTRFLPDIIMEEADAVTAQAVDRPESISLRRTSKAGTWRFPSDRFGHLNGSYRLRAFANNELVDWRTVSFTSEVRGTEYLAPSNPDLWLGEGGFQETAPPSDWPAAPGDCFETEGCEDRGVVLESPPPETGAPEAIAQSPIVDELISFFAVRSHNQQGILEFELVGLLKEHLSLDWNSAWYVHRAWVEIGAFESLSLRTWRTRKCFARKPCLVAYPIRSGYRIALFGLVPLTLRTTFETACRSLNCPVQRKLGLSPWVPWLSLTDTTSVDDLRELQRRAGLERVVWLKGLSRSAIPIASVPGAHGSEPLNWDVYRIWDFERQLFVRPENGHGEQTVVLRWYRRSDRCDYFSISQSGLPVWWGWSKTWALLRAYDLARDVPFKGIGRRSLTSDAAHIHLPLPLARALAMTGPFLPGPFATNSKDVTYCYSFPSRESRKTAIQSLWTNLPNVLRGLHLPPIDLEALWRESTACRLDALPMPVLLRDRLASDRLLRRFAKLQAIPRSVLPILLSLADRHRQTEGVI